MKNQIIDQVIAREGGYSDDAADSGGQTMWGVTEKIARKAGYEGLMHEMPREKAVEIYSERFWPEKYDDMLALSPKLTAEIFDTSVNHGNQVAGKFLQRSLNVLNRGESDYPDVKVDGVIGSKTIKALAAFLDLRRGQGELALLTAVNALQGEFYISLCEKRKKDERFLFGWLRHRIILKEE
jgi:lysozyme family protein